MADVRVSTLSAEKIRVLVTAHENGNPVDPTADPVFIALTTASASPGEADFEIAEWEDAGGGAYYARILVGPGSDVGVLSPGSYAIWVKVVDDPEVPVKRTSNRLVVY